MNLKDLKSFLNLKDLKKFIFEGKIDTDKRAARFLCKASSQEI